MKRRLIGAALALLLTVACGNNRVDEPVWDLATGPRPSTELPSSPAVASWLEFDRATDPGLTLARIIVMDSEDRVFALPTLLMDECHPQTPQEAPVSPDGSLVAVALADSCESNSEVRIIRVATGEVVASFDGEGFGDVAWAPDSKRVAISFSTGPGRIADISGRIHAELPSGFEPDWTPSETLAMASNSTHNNVAFYDAEGNRIVLLGGISYGFWMNPDLYAGRSGPGAQGVLFYGADGVRRERKWSCPEYPATVSFDEKKAAYLADGEQLFGDWGGSPSYLEACDMSTGRARRLSADFTPVVISSPVWLSDSRIALLVGDTMSVVNPESGRHRVLARAPAAGRILRPNYY